jgi:hypothetical protein
MDWRSDFLFARPSFIEGLARILDFGGTMTDFNRSVSAEAADRAAIAMDWRMVGQDIRAGIQAGMAKQLKLPFPA